MLEFCRTTEYDAGRAGATRLHLELSRDKLEAVNRMITAHIPAVARSFKDLEGDGTVQTEQEMLLDLSQKLLGIEALGLILLHLTHPSLQP